MSKPLYSYTNIFDSSGVTREVHVGSVYIIHIISTPSALMFSPIPLQPANVPVGRVHNSYMLVLRLCCEMVVSQHVVDTGQMLYKYMI